MNCRPRLVALWVLVAAAGGIPAFAEEPQEANPPLTDVGDLWRRFRHREVNQESNSSHPEKPSFLLTPSLGSKPSTGFSLGFNGNTTFVLGEPRTTQVSSISGGFKFSQKKQSLGSAKVAAFTNGDRWSIQADAR